MKESGREIPVVYKSDVVVVGGYTGAVTAAIAAAELGCSVALISKQPYLGFDMCGTYRLWLEPGEQPKTELAREIYGISTTNAGKDIESKDNIDYTALTPPTPIQVKLTLERALLKAGVKFLYCCYPTDILHDRHGNPAGIVMANRAGRQAIIAKVIIDATMRSVVTRRADAKFSPYPQGVHEFTRVVVGNLVEPRTELGIMSFRIMPTPVSEKGGSNKAIEYRLKLEMKDDSIQSFALAEQKARDLTWDCNQVDASEAIFQVPPDHIRGKTSIAGSWPEACFVDLDAFRPVNVKRIFVLGGCADIARSIVTKFLRPLTYMDMGTRIGKAAAKEAKTIPRHTDVGCYIRKREANTIKGTTRELLNGLRPTDRRLPIISVCEQYLSVIGEYDVVVVGGGTAGAAAGISAARQGSKTLVIEYMHGLGGLGTVGHVSTYFAGYRDGFTKEIDEGVKALGGLPTWKDNCWNIESKMEWYRKELLKAGGDLWFHVLGVGAYVEDKQVKGVVVATPQGRGIILSKVVIDSTGNADIAISAGADYMFTDSEHAALQGTGIAYRDLHPVGKYGFVNLDWAFVEESDLIDIWHALIIGKERFSKKYDLVHLIQTRERRRVVGDYILSPLDIVNQRTFSDTIMHAISGFDSHGFFVHPLFVLNPTRGNYHANVPYRCFLPKGLEGILVTGLGISAHRDAIPVIRMQSDVQKQGYAIGLAAAMTVQADIPLRSIDIRQLQQHLVDTGNLMEKVLYDTDSYPISNKQLSCAVYNVANMGYEGVSIILAAEPMAALDLLKRAYSDSDLNPEGKLRLAQVLAVLGDATGIQTVIDAVNEFDDWDEGWNFRVYGIYGNTRSYLDSLIMALGLAGDTRGLECIIDKLKLLDSNSAFSHHRAVAIALESLGSPDTVRYLAALLDKPGMKGYAVMNIDDAKKLYFIGDITHTLRHYSLREIILARALYRLGDYQNIGKTILEQYSKDLRSHFARHAYAILSEGPWVGGCKDV